MQEPSLEQQFKQLVFSIVYLLTFIAGLSTSLFSPPLGNALLLVTLLFTLMMNMVWGLIWTLFILIGVYLILQGHPEKANPFIVIAVVMIYFKNE